MKNLVLKVSIVIKLSNQNTSVQNVSGYKKLMYYL